MTALVAFYVVVIPALLGTLRVLNGVLDLYERWESRKRP